MTLLAQSLCFAALISWASSIKLWDRPGDLPTTIPASSRASLTVDIQCTPRLVSVSEAASLASLEQELLAQYCNSTCVNSLTTWTSNVVSRCGTTRYDWDFNITRSGNDIAQPMLWAQHASCLTRRSNNTFCAPAIASRTLSTCDDCSLQYLAQKVNAPYAPDPVDAAVFSQLSESCAAIPSQYPYPSTAGPGQAGPPPVPQPEHMCLGTNYTVKASDTCESIASANGLAIDRFLAANSIDVKCQSLSQGSTVCLDGKCLIHKVKPNETCEALLSGKSFTMTELLSWNPVIHSSCDNLASLANRTICVSPPGSDSEFSNITVSLPPEFWTPPTGSWVLVPTLGTDAPNNTITFAVPTLTVTANSKAASNYAPYTTYCPITPEDIENGFEWGLLSDDCTTLLEPYCSPEPTGKLPTSTTFPESCLPSWYIG